MIAGHPGRTPEAMTQKDPRQADLDGLTALLGVEHWKTASVMCRRRTQRRGLNENIMGVDLFRHRWPGIGRRNADESDSRGLFLLAATTGHRPRRTWRAETVIWIFSC